MTSVDGEEISRHAHYRRLGDEVPGNDANRPLDITGRCCVPCAIVQHSRAADLLSADGTPMCCAHYEFQALSDDAQARVIKAFTRQGVAFGWVHLAAAYGRALPRCQGVVEWEGR